MRAIGALALLFGLWAMWNQREAVVEAYANQGESTTDVRLGGVNLGVQLSPVEASPFEVLERPDTRRVPTAVVFAPDEDAAASDEADAATDDDGDDGDDGEANEADEADAPPPPPEPPAEPPPIHGGTAWLEGVVTGPDGPIPFATIRLERHTSEGLVIKDVTANSTGRWSLHRLLGGRYRVRAWAAGEFTMPLSHVFFLPDGQTVPLDLTLAEVDTEARLSVTDAGPIYVGYTGTIAISVTTQTVDDEGILVVAGVPGAIVTLSPTSELTATPTIAVADGEGVARFTLACHRVGSPTALVHHEEQVIFTELPNCIPVPPPPTTTTTVPPPVEVAPSPTPAPSVTAPARPPSNPSTGGSDA